MRYGRIEVTDFRIAMRERNVLATRIKCLPARWLLLGIAAEVAWIFGVALGSAAMGRFRLAGNLLGGIAWNASNLRETLRRRGHNGSPLGRVTATAGRTRRGLHALSRVSRHGLPRFVG